MTSWYAPFLLPDMTLFMAISVLIVFFISGTIKGFLGIGLPAAAMAFLTLFMEPRAAISLMVLPILFTNSLQYLRAPEPKETAKEYWMFALAIIVAIFVTSLYINRFPTALLTVSIGFAMVVFSLQLLAGVKLPVTPAPAWQIGVGLFSGVLGGLSSIWSPPVAMYLLARNVDKDKFISATGFLFLAGCLPLFAGLVLAGVVTTASLIQSLMGLVAVLCGFRCGEILRGYVSQRLFRLAVLSAFLIMGLRLIITGLI
jgi:uncharacterized membrane protein YfcA